MEVGSIFLYTLSNKVKSNNISLVFVISSTGIKYSYGGIFMKSVMKAYD